MASRILGLPIELIEGIFRHLDARSLARLAATCTCLFRSSVTPIVRVLRMRADVCGRACPHELPLGASLGMHLAWIEFRLTAAWRPFAACDAGSFVFFSDDARLSMCKIQPHDAEGGAGAVSTTVTTLMWTHPAPTRNARIGFVCVAVGCGFGAVVSTAGTVYTWGDGHRMGCLGHGNKLNYSRVPTQVQALAGIRVRSISVSRHCLAVTETGEVFSWGCESEGACGHGRHWMSSTSTPRKIDSLAGTRVRSASAGDGHSIAVTEDGVVYSFGRGHAGQLGHGDEVDVYSPKVVEALGCVHITSVAAGETNSLALAAGGSVFSWGSSKNAKIMVCTPTKVDALGGFIVHVVDTANGERCAVTSKGELFGWETEQGRDEMDRLVLRRILRDEWVVSVSLCNRHNLAVTRDGRVFRWSNLRADGRPFTRLEGGSGGVETHARYTDVRIARACVD